MATCCRESLIQDTVGQVQDTPPSVPGLHGACSQYAKRPPLPAIDGITLIRHGCDWRTSSRVLVSRTCAKDTEMHATWRPHSTSPRFLLQQSERRRLQTNTAIESCAAPVRISNYVRSGTARPYTRRICMHTDTSRRILTCHRDASSMMFHGSCVTWS